MEIIRLVTPAARGNRAAATLTALRRALASAQVALSDADDADTALSVVVAAQLPRAPPAGAWIWLADEMPAVGDVQAAALAGAYDVVDASASNALSTLVDRIREASVVEPPPPSDQGGAPSLVATSAATRKMITQIARAARTSMPVLLFGETGTGKDVAARLIHAWSARASKPFVPIHCAAIPNELMEAELFGYAKGAFSGAVRNFEGQLTAATGGTVFLDEIDDTPSSTQVKLLRVLEDHVVTRLGESTHHTVDFRILAATNRNLRPLIDSGVFGRDLYERLAIVSIQLPPLRERLEDLPALVQHMIERYYVEEKQARTRVTKATPQALMALARHPFTGNIRELRNVIFEALVYKRAGTELLISDLPRRVLGDVPGDVPAGTAHIDTHKDIDDAIARGAFNLKRAVEDLERNALRAALTRAGGNRAEAARLLGEVGRGTSSDPSGTVRAMIARLGLSERRRRRRG